MSTSTVPAGSNSTSTPEGALTVSQAAASLLGGFLSEGEPENREEQPEGEKPDGEGSDDEEGASDEAPDSEDITDSDADDETQDEPPAPRKHKLKLAGSEDEIEVDDDELKAGYLRRSDYTRKTQAVAAERKAAEAEKASIAAERAQYAERIIKLDEALTQATPAEPDWEILRKTMPAEKLAVNYIAWQEHKKKMDAIKAERVTAEAAVAKDRQEQHAAALREEYDRLLTAVPEWKEPAKFKAGMSAIAKYAVDVAGFTPDELKGVTDHRVIKLLRTAQKAHAATAKRVKPEELRERTEKQVEAPTRSATERTPVSATTRALQSHAKLRSVASAASALKELLG